MNKEIVLATNNKHKLKEFREVLSPLGYLVYCPNDLNIGINVDEVGDTYNENALLKAKAIADLVNFPVIADDSGLEICSLNKFPGVHSSRFADQFQNYEMAGMALNEKIGNLPRNAEFHCVICLLEKRETKPLFFEGICKGIFLEQSEGENGFGYDPFFYSEELNKPLGLATDYEKNKISHRAKAIKKLITYLSI